jgi:alpha-glucosidase
VHVPWWQSGVVYQIYPRSFADGDGDGIGDLAGLRARLDHLAWLGVDAVWLSPTQPSPMADFGYDVADYCDIDPVFGDLATFDALVDEAHQRDLKVLMDWVPNHTSDQHPWFVASRSSRHAPERSWYLWRDGGPDGGPPNNWVRSWSDQPAWTFDEATDQWYLHCFLPEQPDLNWADPDLRAAMHDTLRFWLDRGVDGFRMDVVHLIGKDPGLPDDPPELAALSHVILNDRPETHEHLRGIRKVLDDYPGDRVSVGEVYLLDPERVATYYGDHDELHLSFNFAPVHSPWRADLWREHIATAEAAIGAAGAWPTWVLSNHDVPRHRTRFGGSEAVARSVAVLLLGLRGTPFLYAGEELGLEDAVVPPARVVDPGGRDGCRAPIPWTRDAPHGWDGAEPWLPWPPQPGQRSLEALREDPSSILHLYRRLLALRRSSPALRVGSIELLDAVDQVVTWSRREGDDHRIVAVNFSGHEQPVGPTGTVAVSSLGRREGEPFDGTLAPHEAVVLTVTSG